MVQSRESVLPLAVVELIERMTSEEQAELASYLGGMQWRERKRGREPEVYIELGTDDISFEVPPEKVLRVIQRLAVDLGPEEVEVRFDENGRSRQWKGTAAELAKVLEENRGIVMEEPVVIELGGDTLYSNGGGCMLLKTSAGYEVKRAIAQWFLELCGCPYPAVTGERFTALVRNGELSDFSRLLAEGTRNDAWEAIEGFSTVCRKIQD
jgi:hypothetical protein